MPTSGTKRPYHKGQKIQVTKSWTDRVRTRLEELGKDHRWLESQIGAGRASVTKVLGGHRQTSNLVEKICEVLDIPMPTLETDDEREQALILAWRKMDDAARDHLLGIAGALSDKPKE